MIEICKIKECTGCEACASICPLHCIEMRPDQDGFYYPVIDGAKCNECGKCVRTCPNHSELKRGTSDFYMGWHKDDEVLLNSSSGGAFTAIADLVFGREGIVFGAWFDEEKRTVEHIGVDTSGCLGRLRLSKYFQGRINDCYKMVETQLNTGRMVLFSGTGCQVAGLYKYLGRAYENLISADVLCHGITSGKVIGRCMESKEKKYGKKIKTFRFRLKPSDSDWMQGGGTRMRLDFDDGTRVIEEKDADTFFLGFNRYLFLRKSCYNCKYCGTERISDITLADFWGVDLTKLSESQQKKGVSLIAANSDKGRQIVKKLFRDMVIEEADRDRAIAANQAFRKPGAENDKRRAFFSKIDSVDFDKLVYKYNWTAYLKMKARGLLGDKIYEDLKKLSGRA